jgi:hypothetical protein
MNKWTLTCLILVFFNPWAGAETLLVRHDHDPWGKCTGEVILTDEGIEYRTEKENHNRQWKWVDIQSFDRKAASAFSILSYEDQKLSFGADRSFNFTILPDAESLSEATYQFIFQHLGKPGLDRVSREIEAEYQVPVKHLHAFGGCEGTLYFGRDWIVYETAHPQDARTWKRDREIQSVWSLNRYQLEIHVFEENKRAFDKTRRFRFQLKEPLNEDYYDQLRREFVALW